MWPYGYGAEPLAVVLQRGARRVEMAFGLTGVLRLEQQPHLDGIAQSGGPSPAARSARRVRLEARRALDVIRARRPREVVDVFLVVAVRRRVVGVVAPFALDAGGADRPAVRHRQRHVVDAVVGEELGAGVELMAVPALVLQDAELGEPLRDEEEVADGAGARERARDVRGPFHFDGHAAARRDRPRQRHGHHRLIVRVAVVWRDEMLRRREVGRRRRAGAQKLDRVDVDARPVALPQTVQAAVPARGCARA